MLKVLYRDITKTKNTYWICECMCDLKTIKSVRGSHLKSGRIQSCGCLYRKKRGIAYKNTYKNQNDYVVGYSGNNEFLIDVDDFEKVKSYNWYFDKDGYVCATINGKPKKLHRFLLNVSEDEMVDHADRCKSNNRKYNLRVANDAQNSININTKSNNNSGFTGVDLHRGFWRARIGYNNKSVFLGMFNTFNEAKKARIDAEMKYYGIFSPNYEQEGNIKECKN